MRKRPPKTITPDPEILDSYLIWCKNKSLSLSKMLDKAMMWHMDLLRKELIPDDKLTFSELYLRDQTNSDLLEEAKEKIIALEDRVKVLETPKPKPAGPTIREDLTTLQKKVGTLEKELGEFRELAENRNTNLMKVDANLSKRLSALENKE